MKNGELSHREAMSRLIDAQVKIADQQNEIIALKIKMVAAFELDADRQNEIAELKEKLGIAVEALEACCEKEDDGHGGYVGEAFETNAVLDGRKALSKIN